MREHQVLLLVPLLRPRAREALQIEDAEACKDAGHQSVFDALGGSSPLATLLTQVTQGAAGLDAHLTTAAAPGS